jgi:integrase
VVASYRIGDITMIPRGGRWHCRFQIGKKRIPRTTREPLKNTAKAETRAREIYQAALARSQGKEPCPTLQDAFRLWCEHPMHILQKSTSHVENIERYGRLHLGALADLRLYELTDAAVEDELGRFLQTHAVSTGNQWLTYIRIVCRWGIKRKMINAMPFDVPEAKVKEKPKILIPTSKACDWLDEVEALTEGEPAIGMVLTLEIGLGLRGVEAREARWEWLDLERGYYVPMTKGGEAWPRPVPPWLLDVLAPAAKPSGWMIPAANGKPVGYGRSNRVFHLACEAIGLPKMVPHRLRATYATWLLESGHATIKEIQVALGHKDIRTTAIYLGCDLGRIAQGQRTMADKTGLGRRKAGARWLEQNRQQASQEPGLKCGSEEG